VVSRWLDLIFQYAPGLLAAFLVLPLAGAGVNLALDRSQTVTTRIWVDRPSFLGDLESAGLAGGITAADGEATLIQELVHTDSFLDTVLGATNPDYGRRSDDERARLRSALQANLTVSAAGPNVVVISYLSATPSRAVLLLDVLIRSYGQTVEAIEEGQIATTGNAIDSQLVETEQAMKDAGANLHEYVRAHSSADPKLLVTDPTFITLSALAQSKTSAYLSVLALSEQAQLARASIPSLRTSVFHVLDPPAVQPATLSLKSPAVKVLLSGFGGVALLEALLVYLFARRDPRIRCGEEVEQRLGLRLLGSIPVLKST
jgi:hypothetical protein